jgi:preprotein translocase subunit SecA
MLNVLDERWKDHLYDLDQLRNAIQYRAWGQKDPLVEYKREAFEMFEDLVHDIQSTFTERFFKIQVSAERPEPARAAPPPPLPPEAAVHHAAPTSGADDLFMGPPRRVPAVPPAAPPRGPTPAPAVTSSLGPVGRTTTAVPEVGRNDPCPCGSGKKYKKCHGAGR